MSGVIEVSRVKIRVPERTRNERLLAFADVVLADALAIVNLKVIRTSSGRITVQMPSRPVRFQCVTCTNLVSCKANYCEHCGTRQPEPLPTEKGDYRDMVHPVHQAQRRVIEMAVLRAFVDMARPTLRVVPA